MSDAVRACSTTGCPNPAEYVYLLIRRSSAVYPEEPLCASCAEALLARGLVKGHYVDEYVEPLLPARPPLSDPMPGRNV